MKFGREVMPLKVASMPYVSSYVASTIPKFHIFKLLRWTKTCTNQLGTILNTRRYSEDEQLLMSPFSCESQNERT
jgi:hypothetical protein